MIISDLTRPHMTGEVLAKEPKALRPDLPVIICTGYSTKLHEDRFRDIGVTATLIKPVTFDEMANAIQKALDGGI